MDSDQSPGSERSHALPPRLARRGDLPSAPDGKPAVSAPLPEIDWRRGVAACRRYKWLVLGGTVLGTAAGFGVTRLLHPQYVAQTTLWVDVPDLHERDQGPFESGQLVGPSGWVDLVQSHVVLDAVVDELRLYLTPGAAADSTVLASFRLRQGEAAQPGSYRLAVADTGGDVTLSTADGVVVQRGRAGDSLGVGVGFAWAPPVGLLTPGRVVQFGVATPYAAAQVLTERLRVTTDLLEGKVGNFMRLELRGPDRTGIAIVLNAVARRFVAVAAELKRRKLAELRVILAEQVRHARDNLRRSAAALRAFRVRTATLLAHGSGPAAADLQYRDPAFAGLLAIKVEREQVQRDREAIERALAHVPDSSVSVDELGAIGSVQRSAELSQALKELIEKQADLRALRYHYTDAHPPVRHAADQVVALQHGTIAVLARALVAQLAGQEQQLAQRIDSTSGALRAIPPLVIEDAELERGVTNAELLFSNIQQRFQETQLADASSSPDVRVLDRAVAPRDPAYNVASLLIVLAFMGSLAAAVVGAVVLDRVDPKVRYADQITGAMGLTILGAVPHAERGNGKRPVREPVLEVVEALRGVRLSVLHTHGAAGPLLLTVTSPGRSDGKSFLASNLALGFADAGYRTLLVDGDIRRGRLHRVLNAARKPGLTDCLGGQAPADAVVQITPYAGLSFIGCGTRRVSGPELLGRTAMQQLVAGARGQYDAVIVDSSPLAAGVDAYVLGVLTGNVLLVLRAGVTDRDLAAAKLDVLDRLPVRVLGAVINDVRPGDLYRSYSYYMAGYELEEEEAADDARVPGRRVLQAPP